MRYLNKIIFINSASIEYAEIELPGNTNIAGVSGTGKTSIMRAICYFYTADQRNLGIDLESNQKPFHEHYFPCSNSHIVYEVKNNDSAFCVILTYSNSIKNIQYGFIDAPYNQAWVYNMATGVSPSSWSEITKNIDDNIDRTCIQRNSEYRQILWGCHPERKYKKYMLTECKGYENLTKSIRNIFLNTHVFNVEGLKKNIVYSLSSNSEFEENSSDDLTSINLSVLRNLISDAKKDFADMKLWQQIISSENSEIKSQAENIVKLFYNHKEGSDRMFNSLCELKYALDNSKKQIPLLEDNLKIQMSKIEQLTKEISDIYSRKDQELNSIMMEQGAIADRLSHIVQLKQKYSHIDETVKKVSEKPTLTNLLQTKQSSLAVLKNKNQKLEDSYSSIFLNLDAAKLKTREEIYSFIEKEKELCEQNCQKNNQDQAREEEKLHSSFMADITDVENSLKKIEDIRTSLSKNIGRTEAKVFYQEEIENLNKENSSLHQSLTAISYNIQKIEDILKGVREEYTLEEDKIKTTSEALIKDKKKNIADNNIKIEDINKKLSDYDNSLYSWLQDNKKGWRATIGKVISTNLLYKSDLNPKIDDTANTNAIFGVCLDVDKIDTDTLTPENLNKERVMLLSLNSSLEKEIQEEIRKRDASILLTREEFNKKYNDLKKRQAKLNLDKDSVSKNISNIEKLIVEKQTSALKDKETELNKLNLQLEEYETQKRSLEQKKQQLQKDNTSSIKNIKEKYNSKNKDLRISLSSLIKKKEKELYDFEASIEAQRKEYLDKKNKELSGIGVDVNYLSNLEREIANLQRQIEGLSAEERRLAVYYNEKAQYLDKETEIREKEVSLKKKVSTIEKDYCEKISAKKNLKAAAENKATETKGQIDILKNGLIEYQKQKTVFEEKMSLNGIIEGKETSLSIGVLIQNYTNDDNNTHNYIHLLRKEVRSFSGKFNNKRKFDLPEYLDDDPDFLNYAKLLDRIMSERVIERTLQGEKDKYLRTMQWIRLELERLSPKLKRIESTINNIDKTFASVHLPAVIQEIRLKYIQNTDNLYTCMNKISEFIRDNGDKLSLPEVSFWNISQKENEKLAQQTEDLLFELIDNMPPVPQTVSDDKFSLEDMFTIKFKITENGNSTPWLSDIPKTTGSNGTSIMVKLFLNVMLINISKIAAKTKDDCFIHCMMDESLTISPGYMREVLDFCTDKGIYMVLGSTLTADPVAFRRNYELFKDSEGHTNVQLLTFQSDLINEI